MRRLLAIAAAVLIAASLAPASAAAPLARFDWPRVHGAVR